MISNSHVHKNTYNHCKKVILDPIYYLLLTTRSFLALYVLLGDDDDDDDYDSFKNRRFIIVSRISLKATFTS